MQLTRALLAVWTACAPLTALAPLSAQGTDTFGPENPELRLNAPAFYDQFWGRITKHGSTYAACWSFGQNIWACYYDQALQPIGAPFQVNTAQDFGNQDEPDLAFDVHGNLLVAWSDREGNDGEQMGVFARAYGANHLPLGPQFQATVWGATSQWRPFVTANRLGGWIVTWTADWDGDSYFRVFDTNAQPLTGDVRVNTYEWDAQVDPDVAVAPNGNIFVAFIDYASHGGVGTGLNLWGRVFLPNGTPIQSDEFLLTTFTSNGDQRNPHVAADDQGRFVVVWDDQLSDGSGYGVFARRFDSVGNALGPEFQLNAQSVGDQSLSAVACDASGRFVAVWQQGLAGAHDLVARRFDANAQPMGGNFVVNHVLAGSQIRPDLWMDAGEVTFIFDGPQSGPGSTVDVYARRFLRTDGPQVYCTAKLNSQGCLAGVAFTGGPSASQPAPFLVNASQVVNQKFGMLLYSLSSGFTPFQGGTLCLGSSWRTSALSSGGSPSGNDCSGTLSYDFNALIQAGTNPALTTGAQVSAQFIYRDLLVGGFNICLTNAGRFTIQP